MSIAEKIEGNPHPRLWAEQKQQELELNLELLQSAIESWNVKLAEAKSDDNPALFYETSNEAVADLDSHWGFHEEYLIVAGRWYEQTISVITGEVEIEDEDSGTTVTSGTRQMLLPAVSYEEALQPAMSHGFAVMITKNGPQVALLFGLEEETTHVNGVTSKHTLAAHALPGEVSLTFASPPSEETTNQYQNHVKESLDLHDKLLKLYLEKSEFKTASHHKQKSFIAKLIANVSDSVLLYETPSFTQLNTSKVFIRTDTSTPYGYRSVELPEDATHVAGYVVGVGMLEQEILEHRPLRTAADFIDSTAGLCMIVEVHQSSMEQIVLARQVYIPVGTSEFTADKNDAPQPEYNI